MASQGKVTRAISAQLAASGWRVVFVCVPNSPHVGVIPIPTIRGAGKQRYPDVFAIRGDSLRLVEVELVLTDSVAQDIVLRFGEMTSSINNPTIYGPWKAHVERSHSLKLPSQPTLDCNLVLCRPLNEANPILVSHLLNSGVSVFDESTFAAGVTFLVDEC